MPLLVEILSGSRRGHQTVFDKPAVTLGRHPDNDIVFDAHAEPLVSAHHAEVRKVGPSHWEVADRGSSNGTWVAGRRISRFVLVGRTEIALAQGGPAIALMPMDVLPAQAADAAGAGAAPHDGRMAFDPMSGAPTPEAGYRFGAAGGAPAWMPSAAAAPAQPVVPWAASPGSPGHAPGAPIVPPAVQGGAVPVRSGATAYLRAVAGEMLRRSSRRFAVVIAVLVLLLSGAATLVVLVVTGHIDLDRYRPARSEGLGGSIVLGPPPPAATAPAEAAGMAQPRAPERITPREIVERNRDAIFLLGALVFGKGEGFCTGFAIAERILATNAHCVSEMEEIWQVLGRGRGVYAFQNERPGVRHRVQYALRHPDYAGENESSDRIGPDIGLVVLDGRVEHHVRLAEKTAAAGLSTGDRIYLLGFPGTLNNTDSPVATLTEGVVGRLTDLAQRKADASSSVLIQHSAFTTKGTSGSPLFDELGEVVGVNTGYYRGEATQQRVDPVTGRVSAETVTQDLQNYAIGMRVDLLHDLLRLLYDRLGEAPATEAP